MLEDDLKSSAGAALRGLYDLTFDLEPSLTSLTNGHDNEERDCDKSSNTTTCTTSTDHTRYNDGSGNAQEKARKEAPSVTEARKQVEEQHKTNELLYNHACQLLRSLTECVDTVNTVCAPIYDPMLLTSVSPPSQVAAKK
uniref:Transmembrane protein 5 n=1 Tax=Lygus hesperus TaxID=30085 RepID=A0A0A9VZR6_LYGHE